jgi:hypothetical protein
LGHLRDFLSEDLELALPLLKLEVDHSNLLLLLTDLLLTVLESILLDVRLLVEDTELIVTVNKLDTHVITTLTSLFVIVDEVVHLTLEGVDDQIQFISDVNFLADSRLFHFELELVHVKLFTESVSPGDFSSNVVLNSDQKPVFLSRLVPEDFDFIL